MALTAYNHVPIPSFMYGTAWKKEATTELVQLAVASGFRAIDTANQLIHYQEALVGEALQALAEKGIERDTLFLQTKFTSADGQDHRTPYDASADLTTQVRQSFESSLTHLGTDYVDSYVLHGRFQRRGLGEADWEVWRLWKVSIGRENQNDRHQQCHGRSTHELCEQANVKPMVVQNRCFAALGWDKEVREICQTHGIIYQGFSLLTANREVLADPEIRCHRATRIKATVAQVIFRFAMQIGMLPLTGTTNQQHMKEDLQAEQLTLSVEEVQRIETIAL